MRIITLLCLTLVVFSATGQSKKFSELFNEAFVLLENGDYKHALVPLLELHEKEPKNGNINFLIGNCYMAIAHERTKAIPYYESVINHKAMTTEYNIGQSYERKAPLEAIRFLGQAYHMNYEFEKAIEQYQIYKELLSEHNKEDLTAINRDIRITRNAMELQANPIEIVVEALDSINTSFSEYRPKLNAEENVLFFTTRREGGESDILASDGAYYEDIYYSNKVFGKWSAPKKMNAPINTTGHDACLYISPDNGLMYIYRFEEESENGGSIYESKLVGEAWSEPVMLDASINSKAWETDASLNVFGNTIFFTSDRKGEGERDIWMMKKLPTGDWARAQNLGPVVNTPYNEESPYLHPDGKTLYFSSQGHNTMGGYDVFKCELQEDGSWSEPENLGYPINTTGDDVFYFPSNSGKRAYFSSYRNGGKGEHDLYMLTITNAKETSLAIYKGVAKDSLGNVVKDLLISIVDSNTGEEIGTYRPNESTGKFLFILQPGKDYEIIYELDDSYKKENIFVADQDEGITEKSRIIVFEKESLSLWTEDVDEGELVIISNRMDTLSKYNRPYVEKVMGEGYLGADKEEVAEIVQKDEISEKPVKEVLTQKEVNDKLDKGDKLILNNVNFVYDKAKIVASSQQDLDLVVNYMKDHKRAKLLIVGHTDSKGSEDYNLMLSRYRAREIRNYISEKTGISVRKIAIEGKGMAEPIASNTKPDGSDNPEGRAKNRRVEFEILP